jgi:Tfp pilus assembly protein PilF
LSRTARGARRREGAPAPKSASVARSARPIPNGAWLGLAAIVLVTAGVYARVAGFGFITNYDDSIYVTNNAHVTGGLNPANVAWAFTQECAGNWHPLTMLSHMTDCQLFGLDAGPPHVVNVLLHLLNTVLLFGVLAYATKRPWPSLFVAGLFALHPMHVESVAWIAERKDVLSTFFWLLTMTAYLRYVRTRAWLDYAAVLVAFAAGLLAKPMLVTLPFVLIMMDVWPLGRLRIPGMPEPRGRTIPWSRSLLEKAPLLALVVVSIVLTLHAQKQVGALSTTVTLPLDLRLRNACIAVVLYVAKLFAPVGLAALYPYPATIPMADAVLAGVVVLAITAWVVLARRRAPYGWFGWLWFLGTLVPVIGIVQVGSQSMADRYTYIPHIGLDLVLAWALADLAARWKVGRVASTVAAAVVLAVFAVLTWIQIGYWSDGARLFRRAIEVTRGNFIAHNNYGVEALEAGRLDQAVASFQEATRINPEYATGLYNLGVAYRKKAEYQPSAEALTKSLALAPNDPRTELNLAMVLAVQQKFLESFPHYENALRLTPQQPEVRLSYSNALSNYGVAMDQQGRSDEAIRYFSKALEIKPDNQDARRNLDYARSRR